MPDDTYPPQYIDRARALVDAASPEHVKEAVLHALSMGSAAHFLPVLIGGLEGIALRVERERKEWMDNGLHS